MNYKPFPLKTKSTFILFLSLIISSIASASLTFNPPRGVYDEDVFLKIVCDDCSDKKKIQYTINGSDPGLFNSPKNYQIGGVIHLNNSVVISAKHPITNETIRHTYIFPNKIAETKLVDFANQNFIFRNYNRRKMLDNFVLLDESYEENESFEQKAIASLKSLPIMAVTVISGNSDKEWGSNFSARGDAKSTFVEYFDIKKDKNNKRLGFTANAGGEYFGSGSVARYPKLGVKLSFKTEFGDKKLTYPLFDKTRYMDSIAGTKGLDHLLLRSGSQDTFFYWDPYAPSLNNKSIGQFIRNQWVFDRFFEMGHLTPQGRYVHLYLNGTYWGVYHMFEKPSASWMSDNLGRGKEDYTAVKTDLDDSKLIKAVDGDYNDWVDANISSQSRDKAKKHFYDKNFIDYMVFLYYTGNWDTNSYQNIFAIGPKDYQDGGFRLIPWDNDFIFFNGEKGEVIDSNRTYVLGPGLFSPRIYPFVNMINNDIDFRQLFIDRTFELISDLGVLGPENSSSSYKKLFSTVEGHLFTELSRWYLPHNLAISAWERDFQNGDIDEIYNQVIDFKDNFVGEGVYSKEESYFYRRPQVLIKQLRESENFSGFFPSFNPPQVSIGEQVLNTGFETVEFSSNQNELTLTTEENKKIYYTLDNSDPRQKGGAISESAIELTSNGEITLSKTVIIKARVYENEMWSGLTHKIFILQENKDELLNLDKLVVSKIHYNPEVNEQLEFIELFNNSEIAMNLEGLKVTDGIELEIKERVILPAMSFIVLARNPMILEEKWQRYFPDHNITNNTSFYKIPWNKKLSNDGESIQIKDSFDKVILEMDFANGGLWPKLPNGQGYCLTLDYSQLKSNISVSDKNKFLSSPDHWLEGLKQIRYTDNKIDKVKLITSGHSYSSDLSEEYFFLELSYPPGLDSSHHITIEYSRDLKEWTPVDVSLDTVEGVFENGLKVLRFNWLKRGENEFGNGFHTRQMYFRTRVSK